MQCRTGCGRDRQAFTTVHLIMTVIWAHACCVQAGQGRMLSVPYSLKKEKLPLYFILHHWRVELARA